MKITEEIYTRITAENAKLLQRKSDKMPAGKSILLGYTYFVSGKKLQSPVLEMPCDYEEIDEANVEEIES